MELLFYFLVGCVFGGWFTNTFLNHKNSTEFYPVRTPQIGDKIRPIFPVGNAYNGMEGVVDSVSEDKQSYVIRTETSILVIPEMEPFGKTPSNKYMLLSDGLIYRNR